MKASQHGLADKSQMGLEKTGFMPKRCLKRQGENVNWSYTEAS